MSTRAAGTGTVAFGAFDGVHAGHRALLERAAPVALVTWLPTEGEVLLCPVHRSVELLDGLVTETAVLHTRPAVPPRAARVLADPDEADPARQTEIRSALASGDVAGAARFLGRPPEVEGTIVGGDARGRTLGFPTANLAVEPHVLVPAVGIYAGWAAGTRAAISIGTNPTYVTGGGLRVEAFLLDFEGDLYGQRLLVELWERLRDEIAFASERELVEQIAEDVERSRTASRPDVSRA